MANPPNTNGDRVYLPWAQYPYRSDKYQAVVMPTPLVPLTPAMNFIAERFNKNIPTPTPIRLLASNLRRRLFG